MTKITFCGGAKSVTGSNYLLETSQSKIIIDCGLTQGAEQCPDINWRNFLYNPKEINALIVTHTHADHIGLVPRLVRKGYQGKIYATMPTVELAPIMLEDGQDIIAQECKSKHKDLLYEVEDIDKCVEQFQAVHYKKIIQITPDIKIRFRDAGHILGSSSVEVFVSEAGEEKKVVFSGDLGNPPTPLLSPIDYIEDSDYVLMESTYGNRFHEDRAERVNIFKNIINDVVKQKGVLMIPAFALERTQEILFELNYLVENNIIPSIDMFLDSPLAIKATEVYRHSKKYFNKKATNLILNGDDIFDFPNLKFTERTEESKAINDVSPPKIIIAGSGMSNGGRILHHEKRYLSNPNNTILFIGYQAIGTLGRAILEGSKDVTIFGDTIPVNAQIKAIGGYSAHADQNGLLKWIESIHKGGKLKKVFCVQGEEDAATTFAGVIKEKLNVEAVVPDEKDTFEF